MAVPKRLALDTDVIVDHLRGKAPSAITAVEDMCELATTVVNSFELYYGAYKSKSIRANLASAKGFLSTVGKLEFDDESANKSGEILADLESKGMAIDPRDLFVGCTTLTHGFALLTNNRRHFERIPGLLVVTPKEIDS